MSEKNIKSALDPQKILNEPTSHKSVDYRTFKRGFQASRNQSQSLYMTFTQ
jgi:hypothetical protein